MAERFSAARWRVIEHIWGDQMDRDRMARDMEREVLAPWSELAARCEAVQMADGSPSKRRLAAAVELCHARREAISEWIDCLRRGGNDRYDRATRLTAKADRLAVKVWLSSSD